MAKYKRSELRLLARAIKERWPIPDELRIETVLDMASILRNNRADLKTKVSAARVIVAADRVNIEQQRVDILKGETGVTLGSIAATLENLDAEHDERIGEDSEDSEAVQE
jgi:hypothetical protein